MTPKGGQVLERFARLAAAVTRTSAAFIGVLGERKELGTRHAALGLTRPQIAALWDLERILADAPPLTVIADLTQDERLASLASAFRRTPLRFIIYMKLISLGREPAGFICLLGDESHGEPTRAEVDALENIASIVMADRQREQRHLHLMHVADRALRIDRMLRLVSEAESCADGLTSVLEVLCQYHGATHGRISRLIRPDHPLLEVSRYGLAPRAGATSDDALSGLHDFTMEAIRGNRPFATDVLSNAKQTGADTPGFRALVCVPIWVHHQRFGISLAFTKEKSELGSVVADIASLGDAIRPALFQKVTEERIRFAAYHDDLTQLANRLMFQERLRKALSSTRNDGGSFAVLCLDLDGFKLINDRHGHGFGDSLLVGVAQRLRENVRASDTVARMGGDEFAIIQQDIKEPSEAVALAERLLDIVGQPFELAGRQARVGVSVGIAICPQHGDSPDLLLRNADQALYQAKRAGRQAWSLFDPTVATKHEIRQANEHDLEEAISRGDFTLAWQPVCDGISADVAGFEALLRWRHPTLGSISPDHFIPIAEESGLIVPLGRWVLETACAEAANWDRPAFLSVNLSPLQFRQPGLPRQIASILQHTHLPASRLWLEVTEGVLLDDSDHVLNTMRALQEQGIRIMLDDFGTAYASLSYLRRLPFDGVKIDKTFVRGLNNDGVTLAIVEAILSLADRLDLSVVAEGVETERELQILRRLGCRLVQGFLIGRPSDALAARARLRDFWSADTGSDAFSAARNSDRIDLDREHVSGGSGMPREEGVVETNS
jgi:diguanylate cyclase (GGDEF)-like protein